MMKFKLRTCCAVLLLLICVCAMAVPAKRSWIKFKQSDGTTITATLAGDEHLHYYITQDNVPLVRADNGDFHYATHFGFGMSASGIIAHEKDVRNEREIKQVEYINSTITADVTPATLRSRKAAAMGKLPTAVKKKTINDGTKRHGLVILASFSDLDFISTDPQAKWNDILNLKGFSDYRAPGSVADYFREQSNGLFDIEFDVIGPVKMPKEHTYYGKNNSNGDDMYVGELLVEACRAIDDQVNFQDYDWDGDGWIDMVFLLYAGCGENYSGNSPSLIWPHEWHLLGYEEYADGVELDGTMLGIYACSNELAGYENSSMSQKLSGLGTFCHEFSHCLGLADLYSYSGNPLAGDWDLMASGSYNGDGWCPAGYSAFEKEQSGWLNPIVLTDPTEITGLAPTSQGGEAYKIYNDGDSTLCEYYLLENRQQEGWDKEIPGSGLIVTHIDYDEGIWWNNTVNDTRNHERCTIIGANDNVYMESGYAYPYMQNDSLTNHSTPAAKVYKKSAEGNKLMNKPITHITHNYGLVSFKFMDGSTGIEHISMGAGIDHKHPIKVYTTMGVLVAELPSASALHTLPQGIYILKQDKTVKWIKQ